jgi:Fic family protein
MAWKTHIPLSPKTFFLMEKKVLTTPALYISYFLKKNRIDYYDRMKELRNNKFIESASHDSGSKT